MKTLLPQIDSVTCYIKALNNAFLTTQEVSQRLFIEANTEAASPIRNQFPKSIPK